MGGGGLTKGVIKFAEFVSPGSLERAKERHELREDFQRVRGEIANKLERLPLGKFKVVVDQVLGPSHARENDKFTRLGKENGYMAGMEEAYEWSGRRCTERVATYEDASRFDVDIRSYSDDLDVNVYSLKDGTFGFNGHTTRPSSFNFGPFLEMFGLNADKARALIQQVYSGGEQDSRISFLCSFDASGSPVKWEVGCTQSQLGAVDSTYVNTTLRLMYGKDTGPIALVGSNDEAASRHDHVGGYDNKGMSIVDFSD